MMLKHFFDISTGFRYKKMEKSSPSIYRDVHALAQPLCYSVPKVSFLQAAESSIIAVTRNTFWEACSLEGYKISSKRIFFTVISISQSLPSNQIQRPSILHTFPFKLRSYRTCALVLQHSSSRSRNKTIVHKSYNELSSNLPRVVVVCKI